MFDSVHPRGFPDRLPTYEEQVIPRGVPCEVFKEPEHGFSRGSKSESEISCACLPSRGFMPAVNLSCACVPFGVPCRSVGGQGMLAYLRLHALPRRTLSMLSFTGFHASFWSLSLSMRPSGYPHDISESSRLDRSSWSYHRPKLCFGQNPKHPKRITQRHGIEIPGRS